MSRPIKTEISIEQVEIELYPADIASMFWKMDSEQMAQFFNHLGHVSAGRISMQLQYVTDTETLHSVGRTAMRKIGEYSTPTE